MMQYSDTSDIQDTIIPQENENKTQYLYRIASNKENFNLSWENIRCLMLEYFGDSRSPGAWRKKFARLKANPSSGIDEDVFQGLSDAIIQLKKEAIKLSDQRTQINADLRKIAREEELKEIAETAAKIVAQNRYLSMPRKITDKGYNEAILVISDWHYGINIDNYYNKYSPEICRERVQRLEDEVYDVLATEGITRLYVVNLGDMIAGIIHNSIRYQSKVDVITQVLEVSTIIADFLNNLSKYFVIDYYDTLDNHSRIDVNKHDSTKLAQLSRITGPYLKALLQNNPNITIHPMNENPTESIIRFDTAFGHKIAGVHGDKDKPNQVIDNVRGYANESVDLILSAHRHHFSADEKNFTLLVCNGSLMGTDEFAENLRLSSEPSQNLIICSKSNVLEKLHRIILK